MRISYAGKMWQTWVQSQVIASYIISHCHFFFAVALNMHERLGNLRDATKFVLLWVHFLCHLLSKISNISKLEWLKITSKITHDQENKHIKIIHIRQFLLFVHGCHAIRWERQSEAWEELSNPRVGRTKWQRERNRKFLRLPSLSCKDIAKKWQICYDFQWLTEAQDWTKVCYIFPAQGSKFHWHESSVGQGVSEILTMSFFILFCGWFIEGSIGVLSGPLCR